MLVFDPFSILRKGRKEKPGNYRPVVGKLLERIFGDRIYQHLDRHGSFTDIGQAFVGRKLSHKCNSLLKRIDEGKPVNDVCVDFDKAFDIVLQGRLIWKIGLMAWNPM